MLILRRSFRSRRDLFLVAAKTYGRRDCCRVAITAGVNMTAADAPVPKISFVRRAFIYALGLTSRHRRRRHAAPDMKSSRYCAFVYADTDMPLARRV